ncbi:MAG TPA: AsmA family protein, partial [Geoalkalibacter subterraneus]|nr:AsmA family protein [Geoalkalibacter subterraneus]
TTVDIKVKAEAGTFHKIEFAQAAADIHYQAGILQIYPLHADLAPGYYVGRVVWAEPPGAEALLKVSGHLEDVDAEKAQYIQSDAPGLITGTLRGDFYLEGDGGNFIETSRGGLSLEAHNGVLRRFNVLSKVFSLLNVAQIFSFQLPDMAREGMPYQKINANLSLRNGILASEDLLVDSNAINMSMVGKIDLANNEIDAVLGVKPLQTVDSVISKIPIAGWILTGEDKSLIMTHFRVQGDLKNPKVEAIPVTSLSERVRGVFRRVLGFPAKVFSDLEKATQ